MPRLTGAHLKAQYLKVKERNKELARQKQRNRSLAVSKASLSKRHAQLQTKIKELARRNRSLAGSRASLNKKCAHLKKKIIVFQNQKDRLRKQKLWLDTKWRNEYKEHAATKDLYEKQQIIIERYQQHFAVHNY